jgi:Mg-chelatase subunit ChlD
MQIGFVFPAALWLLLLLVPLWALAWLTPSRRAPAGRWVSLAIRSLLIAALVLALAGARVVTPTADLTTVFLVDRSDSIAPDARARADEFVRAAQGAMPTGDRAAVVDFGADALVAQMPGAPAAEPTAPAAGATNIQQAVELGLALLPAETNKRMVLLSDGGENAGAAQAAARLAAARGVPLSYVDLGAPPGTPEALIAELHAPAAVRAGQSFELTVTVESNAAEAAHLRILGDGQPVAERDVTLQPGINRFPVPVDARGAGFQRYRAELTPQQDARAENNAAEALVQVTGPPKVLLVEGQPGAGQNLKDALAAAQVQADLVAPAGLPQGLGPLGAYGAVALINVPASALPPNSLADLGAYVHDLGKGLVMIGGDQSYGLGGYAKTPVEAALPVSMEAPTSTTRPRLAIVYLLDKSSSMDACLCRGPSRDKDGFFDHKGRAKIDLGKDAVIASVKVLNQQDNAGVIAFDSVAHTIVPLQPGPQPDAVQQAIGPIPPKGATNVAAGLQAAADALRQSDAQLKHVIVLTDGWSQEGDPMGIAQQMRQAGITLSVVAEGVGSSPALQQLADAGGGRYFPVASMNDVPQIFLQETMQASSNFMVEQPFTPQYGAKTPILSGLEGGLPALYGYNGTTPKQTATIALADPGGAPVLAQWQYGLGRAVAWTSDTKAKWARDWITWPEFPRFAAQLVGWTLPSAAEQPLSVDIRPSGGQTEIEVALPNPELARDGLDLRATVIGPDGAKQEIPLAAQAAGVYRATIASPPQGTYMVQVAGARGGQVLAQATAALVVPYSAEYRSGQANPALLAELAQATGGARLEQLADAFAPADQRAGGAREIAWQLLLVALALLPIDILARRLMALWRLRPRAAARP